MKDLELTVYPKTDGHFSRHCHSVSADGSIRRLMWGCQCPESSKRLTNAELAAEYWQAQHDFAFIAEGMIWGQMCGHWSFGEDAASARTKTLERFATLPHYDEVPE